MATAGRLVKAIAEALEVPAATVSVYDRVLSEAGIRTKGGRGRSAAKMTNLDAANLLIAVMSAPVSGPTTAGALEQWREYSGLQATWGQTGRFDSNGSLISAFNSAMDRLVGIPPELRQPSRSRLEHSYKEAATAIPAFGKLPNGHTLPEAIAAIFEAFHDGTMKLAMEPLVEFPRYKGHNPLVMSIATPHAYAAIEFTARNWLETLTYITPGAPEPTGVRYRQARFIYYGTFRLIAEALQEGD